MSAPPDATRQAITELLSLSGDGDGAAMNRLVDLVYEELVVLARQQRRRWRGEHTLNTTALVHEAWLKVLDRSGARWLGRKHFFAVVSRAMRQLLVDHARGRRAEKRGGGAAHLSLDEDGVDPEHDAEVSLRLERILEVDVALEELARRDEELVRIIEYRFFAGFTVEETADLLETSPRTIKRQWQRARLWLQAALDAGPSSTRRRPA